MTAGGRARTGVALVAALVTVAGCGDRNPSTLDPRGDDADRVATLWWFMFALGTFVAVLVTVILLAIVLRRRRPAHPEVSGVRWIVLGGIVLPLVLLPPVIVWSFVTSDVISQRPADDALTVEVTGFQYWWEVRYPGHGVVTANEIHVPAGRTSVLELRTADVIHSVWVPNLAGKVDMIPGEDTRLVVRPREAGVYHGMCAEFCGIQHAKMRFLVVVQEPDEFDAWLDRQASPARVPDSDLARRGAAVFGRVGCASCHTVRGTGAAGVEGPDLTHVGSRRTLGAAIMENNRGNLAGWIADPQQLKRGNLMPPSAVTGEELQELVAYLESLR